jgi:hypothetical protein
LLKVDWMYALPSVTPLRTFLPGLVLFFFGI